MKSLEILDSIRINLEDYLERDLQERIKNNESEISINEINDAKAILVTNMYYGVASIKADLEVLEIFKKNIITIQSEPDDDYGGFHDDMFEIIIDRSFKTEDFNKVKQWLEENE